MNIKTIGFSILFMFSMGANASVSTVTTTVQRVTTVVNQTTGVTVPSALAGVSGAAAAVSARNATLGTVNKMEQIAEAIEAVAAENGEAGGMSKELRIQALANIFTVVALSDSSEVMDFVMGKPYVAVTRPDNQGDDVLNGDSVSNFSNLLNNVINANSEAVTVAAMDSAIASDSAINANSLSDLDPCKSLSNAGAR